MNLCLLLRGFIVGIGVQYVRVLISISLCNMLNYINYYYLFILNRQYKSSMINLS